MHVRTVEGFEIVGIEAQALAADDLLRRQHLGDRGIADDLSDTRFDERRGLLVRVAAGAEVAVRPDEREAAALPSRAELALEIFGIGIERRGLTERVF